MLRVAKNSAERAERQRIRRPPRSSLPFSRRAGPDEIQTQQREGPQHDDDLERACEQEREAEAARGIRPRADHGPDREAERAEQVEAAHGAAARTRVAELAGERE